MFTLTEEEIFQHFYVDRAEFNLRLAPMKEILHSLSEVLGDEESVFIAGGAIRALFAHETVNDYDIFVTGLEKLGIVHNFYDKDRRYTPFFSEFAVTYTSETNIVQVINILTGTIEEVLSQFDFTVCQFAYDGNLFYIYSPICLYDLGSKGLRIHKVSYPLASMKHIQKYITKGYKACDGTWKAFCDQVRSLPEEEYTQRIAVRYID